jgi:aminomethyltransferase
LLPRHQFAPASQSSSLENRYTDDNPFAVYPTLPIRVSLEVEPVETLKRTPLFDKHLESRARMVPFGGWEMPVQYTGVIEEHNAVREQCGIFDVSHMGEFVVSGSRALEFVQFVTVNDASKLKPGRAQYSMLPNSSGGLVDDIYVYRLSEDRFLIVVNAANIDKDWQHLKTVLQDRYGALEVTPGLVESGDASLRLENDSDLWALIAAQGPLTAQRLEGFCTESLTSRRKNSVFDTTLFGYPVRMARTGYTGEDGFEIFCASTDAPHLWDKLLEQKFIPCGLGARDTLRLEAGYPLYGHEWNDTTNPLETSFSWAVKDHKDFIGKTAMLETPKTRRLLGLEVTGRGIPREGYPVKLEGRIVGHVTSGTMSPTLKKGIALAYLEHDLEPGQAVSLEIRGNDVAAVLCEAVFVSRNAPGI